MREKPVDKRLQPTVLVVDDEASVRYTLRSILEEEGFAVVEAGDGMEALDRLRSPGPRPIDLVITDLRMPKMGGMELLSELQALPRAPRAIVVTAHGSEGHAVEAMKRGALDYFPKPFDLDEIVRVVRRALETVRLADENTRLRAELALSRLMVFESEAMRQVAVMVERAAARDVTVLVTGESGTGKELVARALVQGSLRRDKPFVSFNCAAIPRELAEAELFGHSRGAFTGANHARRGLFREADGGTLFLDEVGELDLQTQGSLLRALQEREVRPVGEDKTYSVDLRLIAATNRNLAEEVERGTFRRDLYYRLNVVHLHVPTLRERPEDIGPLANTFAKRFGERFGLRGVRLSARLLAQLRDAPWPGNVRELEHTIERLVALAPGPEIDEDPFEGAGEAAATSELSLKERVNLFERSLLDEELRRCHGNQSEVARRLKLSRVTLLDKMKKLGLR